MKVITLKGDTQTGKTQIITEVFKDLIVQGAKEKIFQEEGKDRKDFKALLTFKEKNIAFCSIGYIADYGHVESEYILSGIEFASKNTADVLINAYTTPFSEFPESIYERIIGKSNYNPILVLSTSNKTALIQQIISNI